MRLHYFFFGTAFLSWALAIVFVYFLVIGLPGISIYQPYTTALATDLQVDAVLFGFTVASFMFFLRDEPLHENGKISSWTLAYVITAFWSFFWSFLFGFRVFQITLSPATSFEQVLPFSFTLAGVFVMMAFLVQVAVIQTEKKSAVGQVVEPNTTN